MSKLAIITRYKSRVNHTAWLCQTSLTCSLGWKWGTSQVAAHCKRTHCLMETVHQQTQKSHLLPKKHERTIKNLLYSMKLWRSKGLYYLEKNGGILTDCRHLQCRPLNLKSSPWVPFIVTERDNMTTTERNRYLHMNLSLKIPIHLCWLQGGTIPIWTSLITSISF